MIKGYKIKHKKQRVDYFKKVVKYIIKLMQKKG